MNAGVIVGLVLIVLLALLLGGFGMMGFGGFGMMGTGMMGGYGGMMGSYGMPFGALWMVLFWALLLGGGVWLVVWLVRNAERGGHSVRLGETPLDILKARYARGEVTKEQFDAVKRDLEA